MVSTSIDQSKAKENINPRKHERTGLYNERIFCGYTWFPFMYAQFLSLYTSINQNFKL